MTFLSSKYFSHGLPDCQADKTFLSLESSYFRFRASFFLRTFSFQGLSQDGPAAVFQLLIIRN
jgi:hypothetical protein